MANIIQFYGHRQAYGLSVSPNPLHRNPSYDRSTTRTCELRNGDIQYLVWDSFSAARSPSFSEQLLALRRPLPRRGRPHRDRHVGAATAERSR